MKRNILLGIIILLLLIFTSQLITACGTTLNGQPTVEGLVTPGNQAREPFSARRESGDGAVVAWAGYTKGYEPTAEETFNLTIQNETDQVWDGRYCLLLLDGELPMVLATLEQRQFTLEPGVGFSDVIAVQFPAVLDEGAYGLSLAVRRAGDPMVDLVPIQVGETDQERRPTTQRDMDAALEACPPVE